VDLQVGVADCRARGDDRELAETLRLAYALWREMRNWIEIKNLRRNARVESLSRYVLDQPDAGAAVDQRRPKFIQPASDGRDDTDTGDHDPAHEEAFSPTTAFTAAAIF